MMRFGNRGIGAVRYLLGSHRFAFTGRSTLPKGGKQEVEVAVLPSTLAVIALAVLDLAVEDMGHALWHLTHRAPVPCGLSCSAMRRRVRPVDQQQQAILFVDVERLLWSQGWTIQAPSASRPAVGAQRTWVHPDHSWTIYTLEDAAATGYRETAMKTALGEVMNLYGPAGVAAIWQEVQLREALAEARRDAGPEPDAQAPSELGDGA